MLLIPEHFTLRCTIIPIALSVQKPLIQNRFPRKVRSISSGHNRRFNSCWGPLRVRAFEQSSDSTKDPGIQKAEERFPFAPAYTSGINAEEKFVGWYNDCPSYSAPFPSLAVALIVLSMVLAPTKGREPKPRDRERTSTPSSMAMSIAPSIALSVHPTLSSQTLYIATFRGCVGPVKEILKGKLIICGFIPSSEKEGWNGYMPVSITPMMTPSPKLESSHTPYLSFSPKKDGVALASSGVNFTANPDATFRVLSVSAFEDGKTVVSVKMRARSNTSFIVTLRELSNEGDGLSLDCLS
ncbi:hypothetical protein G2W53_019504 [Senna tora]|uniref:Uncharacterized protein n=1 Tax=Senna tora TaxID=362788 RepID=A0A834TY60_9FABA|nr:hypothetical protein G2W53_019504 [Senna tora]